MQITELYKCLSIEEKFFLYRLLTRELMLDVEIMSLPDWLNKNFERISRRLYNALLLYSRCKAKENNGKEIFVRDMNIDEFSRFRNVGQAMIKELVELLLMTTNHKA